MTVSLCIVAYNEERFLPDLFQDIMNQTYDHKLTEIVLVDSVSSDGTKDIMVNFAENSNSFMGVKVLDNPKRIQAAGWNIAVKNSVGDVIIRIDAHAHIPADFVEKNMKLQQGGEYITGGKRPCLVADETPWNITLLEVENSLFGSSIGKGRSASKSCYVKSMFHAAYRREVFEKVGGFNENLLRTEDNEMHYRMRKAGYKLYCDEDIISYQYARGNLRKMIKQKFSNGFWIGRTAWICPKCLSFYHFIPLFFVLGIILTTLLIFFSLWQFSAVMWGLYLGFTLICVANTVIRKKTTRWTFLMPVLFLVLHVSYGIGTLIGLFYITKRKKPEKVTIA